MKPPSERPSTVAADEGPEKRKSKPGKSKPAATFCGTDNPRYLRILAALLTRARTREEIDRIAGASNERAARRST